jgi:hypothetical protein
LNRGRSSRVIGLLIPLLLGGPLAVQAASVCDDLRLQLQAPARVVGNTAEVRQFANALARQNILIRKIRNDMRSYGCSSGSVIVYGSPNAEICGQIGDALVDAESERDMIAADRNRMLDMQRSRSGQNEYDRQRVLTALDENGCFDEEPPLPQATSTDPDADGNEPLFPEEFSDEGVPPAYSRSPVEGGLRTLCVRTCDGAFFPISSNASTLDFRRQAAVCDRMCPGTETQLYYHSMQDQESADMISASSGEPYRSLPTAFAYRNVSAATRSPSCSCNMASYHEEMKKQDEAQQSTPAKPYSGITDIRSRGEDKPAPQPEPAQPTAERPYDPGNSHVRVVGPQFLPEETSRIDLTNPALEGAQPLQ